MPPLLNDEEWGGKSDRWVAEKCGVSHTFVTGLRPQLATVTNSPTHRTGKDGKSYPATKPRSSDRPASVRVVPVAKVATRSKCWRLLLRGLLLLAGAIPIAIAATRTRQGRSAAAGNPLVSAAQAFKPLPLHHNPLRHASPLTTRLDFGATEAVVTDVRNYGGA